MPVYEFRCTTCGAVYDERRPMVDVDAPATCPKGHVGGLRLWPAFAVTRAAAPLAGGGCAAAEAQGGTSGCACC